MVILLRVEVIADKVITTIVIGPLDDPYENTMVTPYHGAPYHGTDGTMVFRRNAIAFRTIGTG